MIIESGQGNGDKAGVTSDNRLKTDGITFNRAEQAVEDGDGYNINTGTINLTSANKSAVLYVKNTGDDPLIIANIIYLIGNSTGGSGDVIVTVLRNPTAGTIVSGATDVEMAGVNRNFGSSKTLSALMYKGAEGNTLTDGDKILETILDQTPQRVPLSGVGPLDLPKGSSIGFDFTPATSNTSVNIQVALDVFCDTRAS